MSAPRAQSSIAPQRAIDETGAVFRCNHSVGKTLSDECEPLSIENRGNFFDERSKDDGLLKGEKRDNQWLGATLDGGPGEGDTLVVNTLFYKKKLFFTVFSQSVSIIDLCTSSVVRVSAHLFDARNLLFIKRHPKRQQ